MEKKNKSQSNHSKFNKLTSDQFCHNIVKVAVDPHTF